MDKRKIILFLLIIAIIISVVVWLKAKEAKETTENVNIPEPIPIVISTPKEKEPEKTVEVTEEMIEKIKDESYLSILLQIQSFDAFDVNNESLLEAAMRIASAQDLVQSQEDGMFLEYVPRSVVHDIIFELSGVKVTEPIEIEDFYYLYDKSGDYYYVVPVGVNWLHLKEINSINYEKSSDQYIIKCSGRIGSQEDGEITDFDNIEVRLKYKSTNKYVKYQLVSIAVGLPNGDFLGEKIDN